MSTKIDKSNVASIVELNMVQQGMLFQFLTDNDPSLYNVQIAVNITGSSNLRRLNRCCTGFKLIMKYCALYSGGRKL